MTRPPVMGLIIMMLLGISGCAGAPQRFSWSSPSAKSEDRDDSPTTVRFSWWHRSGSNPDGVANPRQDVTQSSPVRSQPNDTKSPADIWPQRRSDSLARLFPNLSRRRSAAESPRSVTSERTDRVPNSATAVELQASRPVTRFRDVAPEPEEDPDASTVGVSAFVALNTPTSSEGEVVRASLPPQERSAASFTQEVVAPQSPVIQAPPDEPNRSSLVPTFPPAPTLFAMNASGEPENLLPQSLMRDQEGPSDSPVALAPIQDQAPSSKPTAPSGPARKPSSDSPPARKPSSDSPPAQKPNSDSAPAKKSTSKTTTPPPPPRRSPEASPKRSSAPATKPKEPPAATKPAADEMKLDSPNLEPAPPIQPPASARESKPAAPKDVNSTPSPPPVPTAAPEPAPPSASAPATSDSTPAASGSAPAASVSAPVPSGSVPAGYTLSPAAQPGPAEFLSSPSLDGQIKSLPAAQLPPPLFPSSYGWSAPTASSQVLPSPQAVCTRCETRTKKCDWKPGKCTGLLIRKLKCLKQFIHEHCPFKKKASKTCCQNCPCCGPLFIGAMPSGQWIGGSPLFAPATVRVNGNPATPQASWFSSPVGQERAEASAESLSALEVSAGTKPSDVAQGGEDLKPVTSEGLDKTP